MCHRDFLSEDNGATLHCDMCGDAVRSNEAHTCQTIWGLFNEEDAPEIQKIDDLSVPSGITDEDAKSQFVEQLERGDPAALQAAQVFLDFYNGVPR